MRARLGPLPWMLREALLGSAKVQFEPRGEPNRSGRAGSPAARATLDLAHAPDVGARQHLVPGLLRRIQTSLSENDREILR
jgi:hypothetical protein